MRTATDPDALSYHHVGDVEFTALSLARAGGVRKVFTRGGSVSLLMEAGLEWGAEGHGTC